MKLPSAEQLVEDIRDCIMHPTEGDLGKEMLPWVERFRNQVLEAAAEQIVWIYEPSSYRDASIDIAAEIRKLKAQP